MQFSKEQTDNKTGSSKPQKTLEEIRKEKYMKMLEDEEAARKIEELNQQERAKILECMLKVMDRQLDKIKESTNEFK